MIKRFKKWWFNFTHVKCDYCKTPIKLYYDAYLFPIKEYKGHKICIDCIKELDGDIYLSRL